MTADNQTTETPTDWNAIWVAMQELGAAMQPVLDSAKIPAWARRLERAMDAAEGPITRQALKD